MNYDMNFYRVIRFRNSVVVGFEEILSLNVIVCV